MYTFGNLYRIMRSRVTAGICLTFLALNVFYFVTTRNCSHSCGNDIFPDEGDGQESELFVTDYTGDELQVNINNKKISWFHAGKTEDVKSNGIPESEPGKEGNYNYHSNLKDSVVRSRYSLLTNAPQPVTKMLGFDGSQKTNNMTIKTGSAMSKPTCPRYPPHLEGRIPVETNETTPEDIIARFPYVQQGGRVRPAACVAWQRTAIIIPYRDRLPHLNILLRNLIPFLHKQQVDATFFVIEQAMPATFNRGALLNIGFHEVEGVGNFDCYILHDVDLIPLNDKILYRCRDSPLHLAVSLNKNNFTLTYKRYFGGVVAFTRKQYLEINGHSNIYFGWGGEDDDLLERNSEPASIQRRLKSRLLPGQNDVLSHCATYVRLEFSDRLQNLTALTLQKGYTISRYPMMIARYYMIKHERDRSNRANPFRYKFLETGTQRQDFEGLNTITYKVNSLTKHRLYTWINVFINQTEIMEIVPKHMKKIEISTSRMKSKGKGLSCCDLVLVVSCSVGLFVFLAYT